MSLRSGGGGGGGDDGGGSAVDPAVGPAVDPEAATASSSSSAASHAVASSGAAERVRRRERRGGRRREPIAETAALRDPPAGCPVRPANVTHSPAGTAPRWAAGAAGRAPLAAVRSAAEDARRTTPRLLPWRILKKTALNGRRHLPSAAGWGRLHSGSQRNGWRLHLVFKVVVFSFKLRFH